VTRLNALLLIAIALLGPLQPARATPGEVAVGQVLREATMQGLNGPPRSLSSYRGKPLIINVWASWCGPCRAEMASLERLVWSGAAQPFTLIGISTDDHPEAARAWLQRSNATFNHYIDRALELENMLGASRLPLTLLVDAQGRVLEKVYGARDWDSPDAIAAITRAFRSAAPKARAAPALRSASAPP
jgi:thiol-disulfide isomerase/thioredoxin